MKTAQAGMLSLKSQITTSRQNWGIRIPTCLQNLERKTDFTNVHIGMSYERNFTPIIDFFSATSQSSMDYLNKGTFENCPLVIKAVTAAFCVLPSTPENVPSMVPFEYLLMVNVK